ncbi:thioesterase family protein [Rhodococcus olei]|uniref:thioesterase family protein n=1 Tax=Rhodococcus olei TaxID=2161675 RepID=UPI003CD0B6C8
MRPYLTDDRRTVGTHVESSHLAATHEGVTVTADVTLIAVDGRTLHFDVACYDESGPIGSGTHRRAIVDDATFVPRAAAQSTRQPRQASGRLSRCHRLPGRVTSCGAVPGRPWLWGTLSGCWSWSTPAPEPRLGYPPCPAGSPGWPSTFRPDSSRGCGCCSWPI